MAVCIIDDDGIYIERGLTIERRALRGRFRTRYEKLRIEQTERSTSEKARIDAAYKPVAAALRKTQAREKLQLRSRTSSVWQRLILAIDFTGQARTRREAARRTLSGRHQAEHRILVEERKTKLRTAEKKMAGAFAPRRDALIQERDAALREKRGRHAEARMVADAARQEREAQRERGRRQLDNIIAIAKHR